MPEETKELLVKLKIPVAILVLALLIVVYLVATKIVPTVQSIMDMNEQYAAQTLVLAEKQKELQDLQLTVKKQDDLSGIEKELFIPEEKGLDTEGVIAGEFTEILDLIRANTIKMRSINYTYDPSDDTFVKGAADRFNVAQLDMEMIANYKTFENFLKDLYKHEHFLDIAKVEVEPYEKDKSVLLINFTLKLYAKKG